jgi:hypothetical protein
VTIVHQKRGRKPVCRKFFSFLCNPANSMRPYITSKPNQKLARASCRNSTVEDRKFLKV